MILVATGLLASLAVGGTWFALASSSQGDLPHGQLRLTSGGTKGVYHAYATELTTHLRNRDPALSVSVSPSTGSVDNLLRMATGRADCGFTAGDAAALAVTGSLPFKAPQPIQAVARVYDDYIHLVVRADSKIKFLGDLKGKSVSVGSRASGVELISSRILQVTGIGERQLHPVWMGLDESAEALKAHKIDAFFWSGGLPTSGVEDLAKTTRIRLVPLKTAVYGLQSRYGSVYRPATIPAGVYGLNTPLETVAVPNFIVCRSDVSNDIVHLLTSTLFQAQSKIAAVVPPVNSMDRRTAIATEPLPLHPGALSWYRHSKI